MGRIIREAGDGADIGRILPQLKWLASERNWRPELVGDQEAAPLVAAGMVLDRQLADFSAKGVREAIRETLGEEPKDFVAGGPAAVLRQGLWDRLHAFYLLGREAPVNLEDLTRALRTLHVVDLLAAGKDFESADELKKAMDAAVVLPEAIVRIAPAKPKESARARQRRQRDEAERARLSGLWSRYVDLNRATKELIALSPVAREEAAKPERTSAQYEEPPPGIAAEAIRARNPVPIQGQRLLTVPDAVVARLSRSAREALAEAGESPDRFATAEAVDRVHGELAFVTDQLFSVADPRLAELMPAEAAHLAGAITIKAKNEFEPALTATGEMVFPYSFGGLFPGLLVKPQVRPLGIGDLKVVKQTLESYTAGEVAHIENVLRGEAKERKHRRFDRSEETVTIARETAEETERDTQTTDRFELKKETEKTIQADMSVDAGITISASYGPVELGAYANFAYSESTTDTNRTSSNFARDVVDRSVTRIQKKTREERITKTIHEVEEINTHGLDNKGGAGHITGVYRWVDKNYKAQIYNYGKRLMFEFIVPEPAAFFIYAQERDPAKALNIPEPPALGSITHRDITEWTYAKYIRDYNVQGVSPPPPATRVLGIAFEQSGMQPGAHTSKASRDLVIPDGYVARNYGYRWTGSGWGSWSFDLLVGVQPPLSGTLSGEDMVVPIAIRTRDVAAYAAIVEVLCDRTPRAYEDWQIKTYEKIMAAHQAARAQYEDKLRAAEARRGVVVTGQNPLINREIERTELKKHSITVLTGERYQDFDSMSGSPPEISLFDAAGEGRFIQFFEQAFEWEQMTYLYYPYFWGRKQNWVQRSTKFDNDPLFTRFLQAGAARVVVPVHPAYNNAILYYLQTGDIWNGGDAPVIDDPLYIALYEEVKDQQDDLGSAVPEGNPWKVVLPTTLVWLQPGVELPTFPA